MKLKLKWASLVRTLFHISLFSIQLLICIFSHALQVQYDCWNINKTGTCETKKFRIIWRKNYKNTFIASSNSAPDSARCTQNNFMSAPMFLCQLLDVPRDVVYIFKSNWLTDNVLARNALHISVWISEYSLMSSLSIERYDVTFLYRLYCTHHIRLYIASLL